jgi:GH35 family endo-1,4-beta-xylanase
MRRYFSVLFAAILASLCWTGCFPDDFEHERPEIPPVIEKPDQGTTDPDPGEEDDDEEEEEVEDLLSYDNLDAYDFLKNYVNRQTSPDFKLGAAVNAGDFISRKQIYDLAVDNLDEMTADNAFKWASVVRWDGSMDFSQVRRFLESAEQAGMTVYGHTLAWHSQQSNAYLNSLIKGKKVEVPGGTGEAVLLEADFNNGSHPFGGWGNNSTRSVENGAFKVTNPSVVNNWEAQFAHDFSESFVQGQKYILSFRIKGSGAGKLSSGFQITDGYKSAGEFPNVNFDTQWKDVQIECECSAAGGTRLIFSFGEFAGSIYIDDFTFKTVGVNYKYEEMTPAEKKAALTDAMDRWIKAVMEVTATKVSAWDAVNESVSGRDTNGDGYYELESAQWGSGNNFYWQDYLGSGDYVRIVIDRARKYYAEYGGTEPLRLFINDYNLESDWDDNRKLKSLIHWIGVWESDGVTKIDGIGTQMHISYYENPNTQKSKEEHIVKMLQLMANTGKLVKISELDMGYVDINGKTLATSEVTDAQHRKMADYYNFIVRKYFEIVPPAQQYGITQWCTTDAPGALGTGWRGGEPVGLFDQNYNRKYAYAGFANGLMGL